METEAIKAQVLKCEQDYWQSIKDEDLSVARRLTDFPCIVAGAQGVAAMDEKSFAAAMDGGRRKLNNFRLDDAQVRVLSDSIAIVAYKVHEDMTVDGKPLTLDAADTSVWIKRGGAWKCALHTESVAGDPLGRDRAPAH